MYISFPQYNILYVNSAIVGCARFSQRQPLVCWAIMFLALGRVMSMLYTRTGGIPFTCTALFCSFFRTRFPHGEGRAGPIL